MRGAGRDPSKLRARICHHNGVVNLFVVCIMDVNIFTMFLMNCGILFENVIDVLVHDPRWRCINYSLDIIDVKL